MEEWVDLHFSRILDITSPRWETLGFDHRFHVRDRSDSLSAVLVNACFTAQVARVAERDLPIE